MGENARFKNGHARVETPNFLAYWLVAWHGVSFCATGGGSRGGEVLGSYPSVPRSPAVSPQKGRAAHGPRHLAMSIPLGLCRGLCQLGHSGHFLP